MTEKEMVDFVVNHAHDTDEAIREQVRKCWELIVVRGRQLEKNAVHVVVPEGGLTPQQMLDVLLAKIERDGIESVAETMSAEKTAIQGCCMAVPPILSTAFSLIVICSDTHA